MVLTLGSECAACGTETDLTFDCIEPCGHDHHRRSAPERICFYRRQMQAGNIQLLCANCNSLKADLTAADWRSAILQLRLRSGPLRPPQDPARGTEEACRQRYAILRDIVVTMFPQQ